MVITPDTSTSLEAAVSGTSARFGAAMAATQPGQQFWVFVANTACWIKQGATGSVVASAAAGSMYVPANTIVIIDAIGGADLAVIEDSAAGKASLTRASARF